MDSSNNAQVQPGNSNAKLERKVKILYVVILILVVAMAFMIFNTQKVANERNESFAQGVQLRGELDKVMEDYNDIRMENQDLVGQMSDKDSLIMANKKEIERLIARQADLQPEMIKNIAFLLRPDYPDLVLVIGSALGDKATLTVMLGENIVNQGVNASQVVREAAREINGGGGGQPFFATAGGKKPEGIENAILKAVELIRQARQGK